MNDFSFKRKSFAHGDSRGDFPHYLLLFFRRTAASTAYAALCCV